jgi:opacity protein-like surface antigen
MRSVLKALVIWAAVAVISAPAAVHAEGYVSPWAAVQFGGKLLIPDVRDEVDRSRWAFGVTAGGMGAGIIGGEIDFGYSPSFFGTENDFGNLTVLTVMGNIIIGIPIGGTTGGGVRPYVTGGVGLIRTQIDGGELFPLAPTTSSNEAGFNVGGGIMGFFSNHFGIRGDVRYMRAFSGDIVNAIDLHSLNFTRLSLGVVFR